MVVGQISYVLPTWYLVFITQKHQVEDILILLIIKNIILFSS